MAKIPARKQVDKKYTWNAESVFASAQEWEAALKSVTDDCAHVKSRFEGKLGVSPETLYDGLQAIEDLWLRAQTVYMYAQFSYSVDTTNQEAAALVGRAQSMFGQVAAATSFLNPELLYIGREKLEGWTHAVAGLATYRHSFDDLFRQQAHVRSAEMEALLGMAADPLSGASNSTSMLVNADFKFAPAEDSKGKSLQVTQSNFYSTLLEHPDRKVRQTAFNSYHDKHLEFKNTLATNLSASISANVFQMRVRNFQSTLSASLFNNNIPEEVFHNLVDTFKSKLPIWHRYFALKRKALKQRDFQYYDVWAPLTKKKVSLTFEQATDYISESLAPLGEDYVATLRRGALEERWVDSAPNLGKAGGAFSYGSPQTHPFIMMSFTDDVGSMSTLAHELGHSMHSYLTWNNQPPVYSNYSLFVAEVASNFHQAMMRAHLLKTVTDPDFLIAVIEEAVSGNFFRYFFQMPTLARFELETHQRAERGEALTADSLQTLMADLFSESFGPKVKIDRPRVGMVWSTFGHLFSDYYVYQYATGISGAHALSARILRGEPNAAEDYLGFLKSGSSKYALDVLKGAGVDLTTPQAVEETFAVLEGYINRLEELVG